MNRFAHFIAGIIFFLILWGLFELITFSLILIPIAMVLFPDVDAGSKYHRNFLTHSIIVWSIVWYLNPEYRILTALVCVAIGFHCLCDINGLNPKKWRGSYTIKFTNHGLNGKLSTVWLFWNFILGLIILGVVIVSQ